MMRRLKSRLMVTWFEIEYRFGREVSGWRFCVSGVVVGVCHSRATWGRAVEGHSVGAGENTRLLMGLLGLLKVETYLIMIVALGMPSSFHLAAPVAQNRSTVEPQGGIDRWTIDDSGMAKLPCFNGRDGAAER